ncbi:MAG: hypothetical protein C6H99_06345 [Epsilonproteobacteria bacterium]|nr:hypothetical protein [Campylobacterota bacterium]NPA63784.1 hypothetical protein [Campylobacterota bacterium]
MGEIFAKNSSIVYMALLHTMKLSSIKVPAISPTFFASIAKMCGVEVELVDTRLDFGAQGDVVHNFFETFTPKAKIVFQNFGEPVGEAEVFVMKRGNCVKVLIEDEELRQKVELFLNGGVKKGRLWNYDLVDVGVKNLRGPCEVEKEAIEASNEVVEYLDDAFRANPYFDILKIGPKTLKEHYPILLKPSLYCPKEDIYTELQKRGIDVEVRFKPLYRTTLVGGEFLPTSEELYKALLVLPLRKDVAEPLFEVLQKYSHRGCRF